MKPKPKQIITIDSESDIENSSSYQSMQIEQEYNNMSIGKQPQQDMYQKFQSSTYFLVTESLLKYAKQINQFLQSRRKSVLFIFGPSGCGKGTLVRKVLEHNKLNYYTLQQKQDQDGRTISLGDVILDSLTAMNSVWPYICFDFPISLQKWNASQILSFKTHYSRQLKKTITKTIFILNEQIYNSFYVLNERANGQENLNNRENVSVIKVEKYGANEMKRLLKGFYEHEKLYGFLGLGKDFLEEVVELANGDARKALNLLYMRGVENRAEQIRRREIKKVEKYESDKKRWESFVQEKTSFRSLRKPNNFEFKQDQEEYNNSLQNNSDRTSNSLSMSSIQMYTNTMPSKHKPNPVNCQGPPPDHSQFMKYKPQDESRCTLYHGLGKLLYGKRLNVKNIPKNKKEISCYYTENQMNELDPPFYFDPILLYQHLRVDLDIVVRLLQENYLERYGKIKNVKKMANIFCMDDGFFGYLDIVQNEDVRELKVLLVTWGILIYNKNSKVDNMGFRKISKSQCTNITRKIRQKKRLLKVYFPESHPSDLSKFAHLTRRSLPFSLLTQTIFNHSISQSFKTNVDQHTKSLKSQDQEQLETIMKLNTNEIENKLRENRRMVEKKKKDMEDVFKEMWDEEQEVDEIEDSDEEG